MKKWTIDTAENLKRDVCSNTYLILEREKKLNIKDSNVWVTLTLKYGKKVKCHVIEVLDGYDFKDIRIYCADEDDNTYRYRMVRLTDKENDAIFDAMVNTIIDKGIYKKYFQFNNS